MKNLKSIIIGAGFIVISACGSSERIIMEDGSVYEIKGSTIKSNGVDISESIDKERKEAIFKTLEDKKAAAKKAEKLNNELEAEQKRLEEVQKEAEEKQEELEEKQEKLLKEQKEKEDARKDYLKAKDKLADKTAKYNTLKDKGKLSPKDEKKWSKQLEELKTELKEAEDRYNKLK